MARHGRWIPKLIRGRVNDGSYRQLAIVISVALLSFGTCCCGMVGWVYMSLLSHVETYRATNSTTLDGHSVTLRVHPRTWQANRMVGPPYDIDFSIRGPVAGLSRGRLLAARIVRDDGSTIEAEVSQPEWEVRDDGSLMLYGVFRQGNWGKTPELAARIELVYAERTVSEEITFTLDGIETPTSTSLDNALSSSTVESRPSFGPCEDLG